MRLNMDLLKNAGIDYEHGFRHYAGCSHHFNDALLFARRNPVFARIVRSRALERAGDMYVCAKELKRIADNLGMAEVYEAASVLTEVLQGGDYDVCTVDTALAALKAVVENTLSGILKARM